MPNSQYGRLRVIEETEKKPTQLHSGRVIYARQMRCICECGTEKVVSLSALNRGATRSCGCLKRETDGQNTRTHGASKTRLYAVWCAMKRRCYNQNTRDFPQYGGRGVVVCEEWRNSFERFRSDMGERPSSSHSLDRIDPNGPYEKDNCRWADHVTQASNKRNIVQIEHMGQFDTLISWSRRLAIPKTTLQRYVSSGLSIEQSIQKHRLAARG